MAESSDYDPGAWKGHDFSAARKYIDVNAGRGYADAVARKVVAADLVPEILVTDSVAPLVIVSDVTGSMGEWPKVMFSKLPYLDTEGKEYLGEAFAICWAAIGDAQKNDKYPLQVRQFTSGPPLKGELEKIIIEGGGGSGGNETYELGALYFARNVQMPKAIRKPIIIFIGDEMPYDYVHKDDARTFAHISLEKNVPTAQVFEELRKKFSVYLIRKTYTETGSNISSPMDRSARMAWGELLGDEHIADLPDPNRVIDVIFGILAKETSRIGYFREELEGRQTPEQVKTVFRSLNSVHKLRSGKTEAHVGRSVMLKDVDGDDSKPLL